MSKPIIEVRGLSKKYKLGVFNAKTLREEAEAFLARFGRRKAELAGGSRQSSVNSPQVTRHSSQAEPSSDFWALRDVSFDVQPGEVIGLIGRNGAGKSTLLKILSRITEPTSGEARIRGRVASLLEVGTGFHPELSGRENVFLNGAILGMTKQEIRNKFDEIVAFAEIEKFIDTPVKRYSSGMYVRLAFAVAAHLEPEILIVDEVLAVGDASFQKKCLGKMRDVSGKDGRTVLFVSHNMAAVKTLCDRVVYLADGTVKTIGASEEVVEDYLVVGVDASSEKEWLDPTQRPGNENISLDYVRVVPPEGEAVITIDSGAVLEVGFENCKPDINLDITVYVKNSEDLLLFESGLILSSNRDGRRGAYRVRGEIPGHLLNAGHYTLTVLFGQDQSYPLYRFDNVVSFAVENTTTGRGHNMNVAPGVIRPKIGWNCVV
jgi:lipopolysaccharide transport system ATP-binding protein